MRKLLIALIVIVSFVYPVRAVEMTAPAAPGAIEKYIPSESGTFASDVWHIIKTALAELAPGLSEAMHICASLLAVQLLISAIN